MRMCILYNLVHILYFLLFWYARYLYLVLTLFYFVRIFHYLRPTFYLFLHEFLVEFSFFSFICMFCRSLFVLLYFFLLASVLSAILRYTDSDYPFGIFKLLLLFLCKHYFYLVRTLYYLVYKIKSFICAHIIFILCAYYFNWVSYVHTWYLFAEQLILFCSNIKFILCTYYIIWCAHYIMW